jgi:hypothetical protein
VTFNSTSSKDATIDSGWGGSITAITIAADYGGTITVSRSLTMSGAFSIAGGSFNSGSQTITFNGAVTISGGTFTASSGTTTLAGSFTHTARGTFSFMPFTPASSVAIASNSDSLASLTPKAISKEAACVILVSAFSTATSLLSRPCTLKTNSAPAVLGWRFGGFFLPIFSP